MSRSTLVLGALSLLALVSSVQATLQIPSSWGTCKRSDPKFDDCLKGAMQRALTDLQDGNADFGVKSMDPFKVKQLRLDKGAGGALSIDMTFSDVELVGLKNAKIESVKSDLNKYKFSALIRTQHLDMNAKYKVIGKVLLIPINGAGRSIIKMNNPLMKLSMQGHLRKGKSGKEFLEFTTVSFEIVPEKSDFQFINPAHATQASLLSRVVSENDKVIMQDLQPAVSESFSLAFGEIANSIFEKVAFQDAFPE